MECNKDEALRAKEIAEQKIEAQDYDGAKKLLLKAQRLFPQLEGLQQMSAVADVHTKAQVKIGPEMDWYGILGLELTTDDGSIKKQYRKLALVLHPDKNSSPGAEAAFKLVGEAFAVLSDKHRRQKYDLSRNYKSENVNANVNHGVTVRPPSGVTVRHPGTTVPGGYSNTFWTKCGNCNMKFQYERSYLHCRLFCQHCRHDFEAVEVSMPGFEATNGPRARPGFQFPFFGYKAAAGASSAGAAAPGMAPTSQYVKQVFEQAKKQREENTRKKQSNSQASVAEMFKRANKRAAGVQPPPPQQQMQEEVEEEEKVEQREEQEPIEEVKAGCQANVQEEIKEESCEEQQGRKRKRVADEEEEDEAGDGKHVGGPRRSSRRKRVISYNFDVDDDLEEFPSRRRSSITVSDSDEHRAGKVEENVQEPQEDDDEEEVEVQQQQQQEEQLPKFEFDEARSLDKIKKGQFWLVYDDLDGMPRWYCRVESVSVPEGKVRVKWLEAKRLSEEQRRWHESGHYVSCGEFGVSKKKADQLDAGTFSQEIEVEIGRSIYLYPKQGEVWGLYEDWSEERIDEKASSKRNRYVAVEVLSDHQTDKGFKYARLRRVGGNIFVRDRAGSWEHCSSAELLKFSHRIPAVRVEESKVVPAGSWVLDGEATDHLVQ